MPCVYYGYSFTEAWLISYPLFVKVPCPLEKNEYYLIVWYMVPDVSSHSNMLILFSSIIYISCMYGVIWLRNVEFFTMMLDFISSCLSFCFTYLSLYYVPIMYNNFYNFVVSSAFYHCELMTWNLMMHFILIHFVSYNLIYFYYHLPRVSYYLTV